MKNVALQEPLENIYKIALIDLLIHFTWENKMLYLGKI